MKEATIGRAKGKATSSFGAGKTRKNARHTAAIGKAFNGHDGNDDNDNVCRATRKISATATATATATTEGRIGFVESNNQIRTFR